MNERDNCCPNTPGLPVRSCGDTRCWGTLSRAAKNGDLQVKIEPVNSIELLDSSVGKISSHEVGKEKHVIVDGNSAYIDFETDRIIFQRIIINLLKNALEATQKAGSVTAGV